MPAAPTTKTSMTKRLVPSLLIPALGVCASALAPSEGMAAGEIYMRLVQETNKAQCGTGKLVEYLHTGGNVHGFFSSYVLACLRTETTAEWVLISGTSCDDPSDRDRHECNGQRAARTPSFIKDPDFWQAKPTGGRVKLGYNLIKYGFGTDCRAVSQKYKISYLGDYGDKQTAWVCDTLDLEDGTYADYQPIPDPKKFRLYNLTTTGKATLATSFSTPPFPKKGEDEYAPALNFIVDRNTYTFDVRQRQ